MISTNDFSKGIVIAINNEPWQIIDYQFVNPGKGAAFTRTKLKNLKNGKVIEKAFRSGERFEEVELEYKKAIYLYHDRQNAVFQLKENNQRVSLPLEIASESIKWLREKADVDLIYIDGRLSNVNLPKKVSLKVIEAPPAIKGDTATGAFKTVKLETGVEVKVPIFIKEGEIIRVNTETGEYTERDKEETSS
jgi:elongation factor P